MLLSVKAKRCCRPVGPRLLLLSQISSISLIFAAEMYLEKELFVDFMLPAQHPVVFSLISHFEMQQFSPHMAGTGINGMLSSARKGQDWPEWPELPGMQAGTGC
jgi:hypothetical protein